MTDAPEKAITAFGDAMHDALMAMPDGDRFKQVKKAIVDNLWDELQYGVIDRMSESIEWFVRDMAERTVKEMLEGREDQMRRYLGLNGYTGRSDGQTVGSPKPIDRMHPVIHGELFETGAIALRKKIAQAHADLIQNERIKDLEDQVASLVAQVRKKEVEIEALRDRVCQYT